MTDNTAAGILGCCHFSDEYEGIKYLYLCFKDKRKSNGFGHKGE